MDRKITAILLLLPFLGCGDSLPSLQTTALSGPAAGLRQFEGRWFDYDGNLIAVVSARSEQKLAVRIPWGLTLRDAALRDGRIVFRAGNGEPLMFSMKLEGNEAVIDLDPETPAESLPGPRFNPCCWLPTTASIVIREPSSAWLLKQSAVKATRKTAVFARDAYNGTMDRLARVL